MADRFLGKKVHIKRYHTSDLSENSLIQQTESYASASVSAKQNVLELRTDKVKKPQQKNTTLLI